MQDKEDVDVAFEAWIDGLSEGWWDDAADACGFLGSLQDAFAAGWEAHNLRNKSQWIPADPDGLPPESYSAWRKARSE